MICRGVHPTAPSRPISRRRATIRIAIEPATTTAATASTNTPKAATNDPKTRSRVRKSSRVSSHDSVPPIPSTPAAACRCTNGSAWAGSSNRSQPCAIDRVGSIEASQPGRRHPRPAGLALRVEAVREADRGPDHLEVGRGVVERGTSRCRPARCRDRWPRCGRARSRRLAPPSRRTASSGRWTSTSGSSSAVTAIGTTSPSTSSSSSSTVANGPDQATTSGSSATDSIASASPLSTRWATLASIGGGVEHRCALPAHLEARGHRRPPRARGRRRWRRRPLGAAPGARHRPGRRRSRRSRHAAVTALDLPPSTICPSRRWIVRSAAAATSGSCVTMTMVWPVACWARSRSSTSADAALSSAPVGSSARSRSGWLATARAMATRCCSPPESVPGRSLPRAVRPSISRSTPARSLAGVAPSPASRWGSSTLAATSRWEMRLYCWKT